jgi:hypothetical protein
MINRSSAWTTSPSQRTRFLRFLAFELLFLAGCAHAKSPHGGSAEELAAFPHIPSPEAGTYAQVETKPDDPVIAHLTTGVTYDASLAGAAAGLALSAMNGTAGYAGWEVREAAWRAGWPYPVWQVRAWSTPTSAPAPEAILEWLATLGPEVHVGLVRARNKDGDTWVGLSSKPRADVGVLPRQVPAGQVLTIPAIAGTTLVIGSPDGEVTQLPLDVPAHPTLDRVGEWLFEVRDATGTAARFPIYAGMPAPRLDLFRGAALPSDIDERAGLLLDAIRSTYGGTPFKRDETLDSVAAAVLAGTLHDVGPALDKLGFNGKEVGVWSCESDTLEGCLDQVMWKPESRRAILVDYPLLGVAIESAASKVRLVALMAAE